MSSDVRHPFAASSACRNHSLQCSVSGTVVLSFIQDVERVKTIALKRPSANDADLPPEDKCSSSISYPEKSKDQAGRVVSECCEKNQMGD